MTNNKPKPFIPGLPIPTPVAITMFVSFHLQMIMATEQKGEAEFHWRQIRYYKGYLMEITGDESYNEQEFVDNVRQQGTAPKVIEAIEKFDLLNLP